MKISAFRIIEDSYSRQVQRLQATVTSLVDGLRLKRFPMAWEFHGFSRDKEQEI